MTCPLCQTQTVITETAHFIVIDAADEVFPCFVRVIAKDHVAEMSDLSPDQRKELWELLNRIELLMLEYVKPHKVNLAQFGNMVPHLHWHIIARWRDDSHFPECPWGPVQRTVPAEIQNERRALNQSFINALKAL